MDRSRLIFVEGIIGSGKSTIARWLARLFRRAGIPTRPVPEARPHPILPEPAWQCWFYKPYDDLVDIR